MANKLNLTILEEFFKSGKIFQLTDAQYLEKIGKAMPKSSYYIKNKSPISKFAKECGYSIEVEEEAVVQRTIKFLPIEK